MNISRVRGMVRDGDSTVTAEGRCFEGISTSADLLASLGITIVLEPGNRQDRGCVNSVLSEGIDVFRRLGRRYLKLMPEHLPHEQLGRAHRDSLLAAGPLVGYVHLAAANRWAPGQGHTAFPAINGALAAIGYDDKHHRRDPSLPARGLMFPGEHPKPGRNPRCERRAREQRNLHSSDGHTALLRREVGSTTPVDPFARMSKKRWGCHPVPTSGS